jgi:chromosome segregation ATPase
MLMGYASYLEDIIHRLNSDLDKIRSEVTSTKIPGERQRDYSTALKMQKDYLSALTKQCERVLEQVLNIVTDPRFDATFGMLKLEEENRVLKETLASRESQIRALNRKLSEMEDELIEAKRANKKMRKDLEFMENPDKFYDRYSTPEMIRKHKRNK